MRQGLFLQVKMECNLCHGEINTKKEKYVCVQDWEKQKMKREMWMHLECFKKAMNRELTEIQKQAQDMLKRCGGIMDKFYGKENKEEEYFL